jgi:hypothetical protein
VPETAPESGEAMSHQINNGPIIMCGEGCEICHPDYHKACKTEYNVQVKEIERLKRDAKFFENQYSTQVFETNRWRDLAGKLAEALKETVTALVSYKLYAPEPYKQNPIYILGSHEAEKKAVEALKDWTAATEKKL